MLVNLRDICAIAEQNNMAIASFNAPSMEALRATIDAAEQTGYTVILSHAEAQFVETVQKGPDVGGRGKEGCVHRQFI